VRSWFALAWLVGLAFAWFWFARQSQVLRAAKGSHRRVVVTCVGLAFVTRFVPVVLLPSGAAFDIASYAIVGSLLRLGHDIYTAPLAEGRHPYFPFQLFINALAHRLATEYGLPFPVLVKVTPVLADVLLTLLITRVSLRLPLATGETVGFLYAVHPVAIYVCAYHGQFDAEPLLAAMLAALTIATGRVFLAGLLLGVAIALKPWPALFVPLFIGCVPQWRQRGALLIGSSLVPLACVALYRAMIPGSWVPVVATVVSYGGVPGWWGVTALLRLLFVVSQSQTFSFLASLHPDRVLSEVFSNGRWVLLGAVLGASMLAASAWYRSGSSARHRFPPIQWMARAQSFLVVTFLALATGFGVQYLSWVIPFALVSGQLHRLRVFTVTAVAFLASANALGLLQESLGLADQLALDDIVRALGLPVWAVTIWWAWSLGRAFWHERPDRT